MSARVADQTVKPATDAATPAAAPSLSRARSLTLHRRCACGGDAGHGASCESCNNDKLLQRRSDGGPSGAIPASVGHTLSQPGRPLDEDARTFMESRFDEDFSGVRVHDDSAAAQSARDVHAHAYTVGQDIVFAPGQYQPHSDSGRHLLAHELAHTVQQRGLQRSGISNLADQGPEYRRLEGEADRAADFAMRGGGGFSHGLLAASRPHLSRVPTATAETGTEARRSVDIDVDTGALGRNRYTVTAQGGFANGSRTIQAFSVTPFYVPHSKGPVALTRYNAISGEALMATVSVTGTRVNETSQWQTRPPTVDLRDIWLTATRWNATEANANWQAAGGDATFPRVNGRTCQMDHIVELQLGGNNTNENIQALDGPQNLNSGSAIRSQVSAIASAIQDTPELTDGRASQIQMRFGGVAFKATAGYALETIPTSAPPASRTCLSVEYCARNFAAAAAGSGAAGAATTEDFRISAGGNETVLQVPIGFSTSRTASQVTIDGNAAHPNASTLISGLNLLSLHGGATKRIKAEIDQRNTTRLPITVARNEDEIVLNVGTASGGAARALSFPRRPLRTNLAFTYPFLSPGTIQSITLRPDGGIDFRGQIRPTVPFLPNPLDIKYENGSLQLSVDLTNRLRSPIPGFTVTSASLSMSLAPQLSASGDIAFTLGRGPSAIATGSVHIGADANGFTGNGRVDMRIPGLSESSITVTMVNGAWAGSVVLEATQIRIPNVTRARVQLDVDREGVRPSGEIDVTLPRSLGMVTLGVAREGDNFVFSGRGRLRVPGLDNEVDIRARYSNGNLRATASNISFTWRSFTGTLDVTYTQNGESPGRVTGTGTIRVARGNVRGSIEVTLDDAGRVSGRGTVAYPLTIRGTRIDASATIIVDPQQNVRVEGSLSLPQPIELFRSFGSERQLFRFDRSIPIPGLSIGPVGVVAVIEGGISAGYSFGPGQLRNVRIDAAFNPLAEHVDPDISFHCELHIPASASLTAMIGGGIGVEAGLARVRGTLRITARLALDAVAGGPLDVRYHEQVFSIRARPGISAALVLGLSLDANARAEAGVGPFTVGVEKTWNLGRRDITLGRFSVYAPISYTSDSGLQVPSMDELEWGPIETPEPANILSQLFNGATATQRETPT